MIQVDKLTVQYTSGKGIFDIGFSVGQGKVAGYLGPNGAGKTTTIRALMGFMRPDAGFCRIDGLDCYADAAKIKRTLGYIPGEIAFPKGMSCKDYLRYQCELCRLTDFSRMNRLLDRFELDTRGSIKKFSKGMKQKLGIVSAFMHDPAVLILDEPTGGLDPLMQNEFISLILEEKNRGKTILLSSHVFEEVERTCDDVLIIKEGRLVAKSDVYTLKTSKRKCFILQTPDIDKLRSFGYELGSITGAGCEVYVTGDETDGFIKQLSTITVTGLDVKTQSLEDVFLHYYDKEGHHE